MAMRLLRVPVDLSSPGDQRLDPRVARYVGRVHRLGKGATFTAFDPERRLEATATIVSQSSSETVVAIAAVGPASQVPTRRVMLVQAVGKGDKTDAIVRDAVELDATDIAFAITARSVASRASEHAVDRFRRIAVEASRQCGRGDLPDLRAPLPLAVVCDNSIRPLLALAGGVGFLFDPAAEAAFGPILRDLPNDVPVAIAVGPEGGFSEEERSQLRDAGLREVSIGGGVLRTETVAAAVLGAIRILSAS